ncbi:hypothetical protein BDD12DRAFT_830487 [Trichophaea hybrida]|nr:hypothetical protein BDD12DRAFT_830487 [Trichophaea hybrida]
MRSALFTTLVLSLSVATLGAPAADRDNRGKLSVYKREPHPPTKHENWGPMLVFTKDGPPKEERPKKRDPGPIAGVEPFVDGHNKREAGLLAPNIGFLGQTNKRHVETKQEKQDDYEYWGGEGDDDSEYWGPEDDADMEHGSTKGSLIPGI